MSKHAALGASSSHRWINCPGSVRLYEKLEQVEGQPSEHAIEGSAAHALAERCLKMEKLPSTYLGTAIYGDVVVDSDMIEAVTMYLDVCYEAAVSAAIWVEQQFSLDALDPPAPMFGTADFIAYKLNEKLLRVVDLKYGKGVFVDVVDNPQLMYYALGALLLLEKMMPGSEVSKVQLTIVQPRIDHVDGKVRTIEYTLEELQEFALDLLDAAERTTDPNAPLSTGSWCRWCRAAPICVAKANESLAVAQQEFGVTEQSGPPAPETLSPEELQWVLERIPDLEEWARQVRAHATEVLESGGAVPGFKLVNKRAYRHWTSEDELCEWAGEIGLKPSDIQNHEFMSPAQLEKKLGKNRIPDDIIEKRSSGVTLAEESDPRPAVTKGTEFPLLPHPDTPEEK